MEIMINIKFFVLNETKFSTLETLFKVKITPIHS